jgi:hypothetical protein
MCYSCVNQSERARWAIATPADVPGSRLLPHYSASHIAKRLSSRRWAIQHLQTFPGAACCHATELAILQSGSPPGGGRSNICRRSREPLAAMLQSWPHCKAAPLQALGDATPADVPGSRLLPRYRASHIAKRLPSRRWAMQHLQTFAQNRRGWAFLASDAPARRRFSPSDRRVAHMPIRPLAAFTPREIPLIALLSAFAALRARSPWFLWPSQSRCITRSVLRDLQDQ